MLPVAEAVQANACAVLLHASRGLCGLRRVLLLHASQHIPQLACRSHLPLVCNPQQQQQQQVLSQASGHCESEAWSHTRPAAADVLMASQQNPVG